MFLSLSSQLCAADGFSAEFARPEDDVGLPQSNNTWNMLYLENNGPRLIKVHR